jgi:type I restriction enzyme S subunit
VTAEHRALPSGWVKTRVEDVFAPLDDGRTVHQGWSPQCEDGPAALEEWGVLKTTAIQAGSFVDKHNKRLPEGLEPRRGIEVAVGDILLTCAGPRSRCGVPCLVRQTRPKLMMSGKMYRFRVHGGMNPAFIEGWLLTAEAQHEIDHMKTGGSDSGLNLTHDRFRALGVVVAPPREQERVVDALDSYLSRIDAAVATLEAAQAKLNVYRASVLKAAVEGRLVQTEASLARAEKRPFEPADVLLKRILSERRRRWEETELKKLKAAGKSPKDDKWKAKYEEPKAPDTEGLPELPEGWCWVSMDAVCFVTKLAGFEYTKYVNYEPDGDLAVIKAENAGPDGFRRTEFSHVKSTEVECLTRSRVAPNDLLMVFVGAGTGQVAMLPSDRAYFLGPNIAMMRVTSAEVMPEYLEQYLRSPLGKGLALGFSKAVAQQSLSMGTIRQIPVALPPRAEQVRIMTVVEQRISVRTSLLRDLENTGRRVARLRQSILKWAFEGRLVDQDPNDEPAEKLLERIRAERAASGRHRSTRRRSATAAR